MMFENLCLRARNGVISIFKRREFFITPKSLTTFNYGLWCFKNEGFLEKTALVAQKGH